MSDEAITAAPGPVAWRDKALPLIFWFAIALLCFRPLFLHDVGEMASPPEDAPPGKAWLDFGSDLLCFVICCAALFLVVKGRIGSIAYNTFREAVRHRVLYLILFFALVLMFASGALEELAIIAHQRIVVNFGLTCINFFGLMATVFVGVSLVYNELERKTIYTIVSKPVHRWQFLLGKFFGLLLTVFVIVAIMTLFFFIVLNYQAATTSDLIQKETLYQDQEGKLRVVDNMAWVKTTFLLRAAGAAVVKGSGNLLGFESAAVQNRLLVVVAMTLLELMIVTAFAVLFSSFSTPTLSAVLTVMVFLAGRLNEDIMRFASQVLANALKEQGVAAAADLALGVHVKVWLAQFAAHVVPNLDSLNVLSQAVYEERMNVWRYPVLYSICYTGGILMLAILIFRRRNFK